MKMDGVEKTEEAAIRQLLVSQNLESVRKEIENIKERWEEDPEIKDFWVYYETLAKALLGFVKEVKKINEDKGFNIKDMVIEYGGENEIYLKTPTGLEVYGVKLRENKELTKEEWDEVESLKAFLRDEGTNIMVSSFFDYEEWG